MANEIKKIQDYAIPVHRSIIHRDLWIGVPLMPLILLGFVTILIIFNFNQPAFLVIAVIIWYVLKIITKNDEWLLDIVLSSLLQPDELR
jgi:type IV secretory pathway VirB3-like protein